MQIGRRFGTFRDFQYSPFPYDARVEYIEGTGTQWINTGITQGNNTITCIYQQLRFVNDAIIFGIFSTTSGTHCDFLNYYPSQSSFNFGQGSSYTSASIPNYTSHYGEKDHTVILDRRSGLTLDGDFLGSTTANIDYTSSNSYYIFRRAGAYAGTTNPAMRLKSFQIKSNVTETLLFDGIPVRFNGRGFMYDKVSKQMFGNSGTGSFTLGPDI